MLADTTSSTTTSTTEPMASTTTTTSTTVPVTSTTTTTSTTLPPTTVPVTTPDIVLLAEAVYALITLMPEKDAESVATANAYSDKIIKDLTNNSPDALKSLTDLANELSAGGTPTLADLMSKFDLKDDITDVDAKDKNTLASSKSYADSGISSLSNIYFNMVPVDTRNTSKTPQDYASNNPKSIIREYKNSTDVEVPGSYFVDLITYVPWDSISSGYPYQLATDTTAGILYYRHGLDKNTWSPWQIVVSGGSTGNLLASNATFNEVLGGDFS